MSLASTGARKSLREFGRRPIFGPEIVGTSEYYRTSLLSYGLEWQFGKLRPGARGTGREVISMCGEQEPANVAEALSMLDRALGALATADAGSLPTPVQAQALRALERAEARHTAARAQFLAAFTAQDGYEDDGQGSARMWLRWQTRVTKAAAAGRGGMDAEAGRTSGDRRRVSRGARSRRRGRGRSAAGATGCPQDVREDADQILAAAAAGGAELADLAGLAQQMYERSSLRRAPMPMRTGLTTGGCCWTCTFAGAGRLTGDLTPGCAAAVSAVLEALGKPAGPEDLRTVTQRRHDALEEACRRLIAAKMVPGRAGQPTQVQVHITLAQLRNLPGASEAEAAWRAAAAARGHGWLPGPDADAAACDATIAPMVTGHVDPAALDRLAEVFLAVHGHTTAPSRSGPGEAAAAVAGLRLRCGGCTCPARTPLSPETLAAAARLACWPWPPTSCLGPAAWHRGCGSRSWPAAPPPVRACRWMCRCRSTPGRPSRPSRPTCAAPRRPATRTAPSPAATSRPASARSIT